MTHPAIDGLVSVVIPVFNRTRRLLEAVASVEAQTYTDVEVIVVDDGSTDGTAALCDEIATTARSRVRTIHQENGGPGTAREAGRLEASGEFIQYLDSDDWIDPRKLEVQVALLRQRPDCGVAYCPTLEHWVADGRRSGPSLRTGEPVRRLFPALLGGRIWQTVSPLWTRRATDLIGPWTDLRQEEDWEYDARAGAAGIEACWSDSALAEFRHHGGERAGGGLSHTARSLGARAIAHSLIYQHARTAGVTATDPLMRRYSRELFLLARQCGAVGLEGESRALFELAWEASDDPNRARTDLRLYGALARALGWSRMGRLACWADDHRRVGAES